MFCPFCGQKIKKKIQFCEYCGSSLLNKK
ncbi:MAG: zinc-ribbon domain-containing protein [Promethearchaeota archaeon]|nr:MAG: zinc-ribbon domain-containing protein [Candidatus Lokiarchaeota archaeon]